MLVLDVRWVPLINLRETNCVIHRIGIHRFEKLRLLTLLLT